MDEFSKFSIKDLNTAILVLDKAQNKVSTSLQEVRDLITKEIESRTNLGSVSSIEELRNKYLGKYVGYKLSDEIMYFRIDNIKYVEEFNIITIETKLSISQDENDSWLFLQYDPECTCICNLNPKNLDLRNFFYISEEEFKEKLNKIMINGTT